MLHNACVPTKKILTRSNYEKGATKKTAISRKDSTKTQTLRLPKSYTLSNTSNLPHGMEKGNKTYEKQGSFS